MEHVIATVEIERDRSKDREISYDQFKQVINYLHTHHCGRGAYGKLQAFLMFLGFTGFRPGHVRNATVQHLLFDDRANPRLEVIDTKNVPRKHPALGGFVMVKYRTKHARMIPLWVRDYFEEYVRRQHFTFANGLLFPGQSGQAMSTKTWDTLLGKMRKQMQRSDPIKYAWTGEVVAEQYAGVHRATGQPRTLRHIHRLSLYSFRKGRCTWYALACLDKGFSDVPLHAAQFMGHSPRAQQHVYRYVKRLLADRIDGNLEQLKPPDLEANFLGVQSPSTEIDELVTALAQSDEVRAAVVRWLRARRN